MPAAITERREDLSALLYDALERGDGEGWAIGDVIERYVLMRIALEVKANN